MLNKYLIIALGVLVASLIATGALLRASYKANGAQKAQISTLNATILAAYKQRELNTDTLDQLAQKNAALAVLASQRALALQSAIRTNPTWGSTPVPKEVQDALNAP